MRCRFTIFAATAALLAARPALTAFTGLNTTDTVTTLSDGNPIWVLRIFANFNDPTDRLLSITAASMTSWQALLYQHPFGEATEPNPALLALFPDLAFDSFVTMNRAGNSTLGDWTPATFLEPGSSFSATGFTGGWFTDGDAPQTTGQLSYLIAQLSIEDPSLPYADSTMIVAWKTATSGVLFTEVTFHTKVGGPAPAAGALPLLGLAALVGARRRR
jgi:MYXO-CTERM domain-containing protein